MQIDAGIPRPLEGIRVLVVDDNAAMRTVVRRFLQRAGCTVIDAGLPSEAVTVARAFPGHLDLALVDLVMPEMSGPECAELLQDDRPEMAVAYMSGYAAAVSDGYPEDETPMLMHKPFARNELVEAIRRLICSPPHTELGYAG